MPAVAAAARRIGRTMQIAPFLRPAAPGNRASVAREKADALTLGLCPGRAGELDDDAQRLSVFLDAGFDPADIALLGRDPPADLLGYSRAANQNCNGNRRQESRETHLSSTSRCARALWPRTVALRLIQDNRRRRHRVAALP